MDARVEVNSMEAGVISSPPVIIIMFAITVPTIIPSTVSLSLAPAIPSVGGHSISAITPDFELLGGLATA